MTTIVYKDGILAADSLVVFNGTILGTARKIFDIKNVIFGAAGCLSHFQMFEDFLNKKDIDKKLFKEMGEFQGIVIDKITREVTHYDEDLVPEKIIADFYCLGPDF